MNIKMLKAALAGLVLSVSGLSNAGLIYDESVNGDTSTSYNNLTDLMLIHDVNEVIGSSYNRYNGNVFIDYDRYNLILDTNVLFAGIELDLTTRDVTSTMLAGEWKLTNNFRFFDIDDTLLQSTSYYIDAVSQVTTGSLLITDPAVRRIEFTRGGWSLSTRNCGSLCEATIDWGVKVNTVRTSVPEPTTLAIFALGIMGLALRRFKKQ